MNLFTQCMQYVISTTRWSYCVCDCTDLGDVQIRQMGVKTITKFTMASEQNNFNSHVMTPHSRVNPNNVLQQVKVCEPSVVFLWESKIYFCMFGVNSTWLQKGADWNEMYVLKHSVCGRAVHLHTLWGSRPDFPGVSDNVRMWNIYR